MNAAVTLQIEKHPANSAAPQPTDEQAPPLREFDGVICFGGEDWWYHNRGHYDMQMMREFSSSAAASSSSIRGGGVPVLYVNSIGMRVPRIGEGRMFVTRVRRKLKSLRRGLVEARRPGFWVFSPIAIPGRRGAAITRRLAPWQVERAARRIGIRRPLVWVACPPAVEAVERLRGVAGLVYQRTDRFEEFAGVDAEQIRDCDARLKRAADVTVFCATHLFEREAEQCRAAAYIDHGVDYERFARAGEAIDRGEEATVAPADLRAIARPRVGFVGGIDSHTFDPALFIAVARRLPHCQFVVVGACSLPEGWTCELPNAHLLGQRPYEDVASYMAACDVLIMPWNENEWIRACNPVKLKEYLAAGRPIVTRPFDELRRYEGYVRIASTPEEFAAEIEAALREPVDKDRLRRRVRGETWSRKGEAALERLREAGLCANGHGTAAADVAQPLNAAQASVIRSNP